MPERYSRFAAILCLVYVSLIPNVALSDTLPECIHTASDYDGDGYGWENDQSCRVTEDSVGPPIYINLSTNTPVNFTRPYWNAYRDFQNRTIQCDLFVWTRDEGYISDEEGRAFSYHNGFTQWRDSSLTFEHLPIQAEKPWHGFVRNVSSTGEGLRGQVWYKDPYSYWTVNDGIYYSNAGSTQNGRISILSQARYVELIDDHNGAIRVWWYQDRYGSNRYAECFDVSGTSFQPSGYMGEPRPAPQPVDEPLLAVAASPVSDSGIVNLETSLPVILSEVEWDISTLYGHTFECESVRWLDDSQWAPHVVNNGWGYSTALSANHIYYSPRTRFSFYAPDYQTAGTSNSARGVYSFYQSYDGVGGDDQWRVENGRISSGPLAKYRYAEFIGDASIGYTETRFWMDSESYDVCTDLPDGAVIPITSFDQDTGDQNTVDQNTIDNTQSTPPQPPVIENPVEENSAEENQPEDNSPEDNQIELSDDDGIDTTPANTDSDRENANNDEPANNESTGGGGMTGLLILALLTLYRRRSSGAVGT